MKTGKGVPPPWDFEEEVDADQVSVLDVFPVIPCVTDDPTAWL